MVVKYLPRILDKDLEKYLTMIGAILIVGPKWCGKTTTAEQHAKSVLKLQDKDNYKTNMMWADIEPSRLLKGEKPRLIDEWQVAPVLWDSVRTSVDESEGYGLYIPFYRHIIRINRRLKFNRNLRQSEIRFRFNLIYICHGLNFRQLFGRTSQNKVVVFDRGECRIGDYVRVRVTAVKASDSERPFSAFI